MFKVIILFSGVAILVVLLNFSCSSSEETKKENSAADSLKYSISIPPGTADIKAEIINYTDEKENLICQLKIQEVFAYGASVSPLPPGTEIKSFISKNLLEKESKKIKEGDVILARISQIRAPGDKEYWELIMFNK